MSVGGTFSTDAVSSAAVTACSASSMLSMVGGALKTINAEKDLHTFNSQCHVKKKDPVPVYRPTPIHVLKAKSACRGSEYDPVSNFTALPSRVTLPSSTKRSHPNETVVPAKRLKVGDSEIEAVFSDSGEEESVIGSRLPASSNTGIEVENPRNGTLLQCLPKDQPTVNRTNCITTMQGKTLSTNVTVTNATRNSSTANLSTTKSERKNDSVNCSYKSQAELNVQSGSLDSTKLLSCTSKEDDEQNSDSKRIPNKDSTPYINKDYSTSSESQSKGSHENVHKIDSDSNKTSTEKHCHNKVNRQHSDTADRKWSSKDSHNRSVSSTRTKSDQAKANTDVCGAEGGKNEVASKMHRRSEDGEKCTQNKSDRGDKKVVASSGDQDRSKSNASRHKHESKTGGSESSGGKDSSSHRHKTYHHTDGKQTTIVDKNHQLQEKDANRSNSELSRTVSKPRSDTANKESRTSHRKHRESVDKPSTKDTQSVNNNRTESCHSKIVSNSSITASEMKHVNSVQNIDLFGEDSDTESSLCLSSSSAQMTIKQKDVAPRKSTAASSSSQSSDRLTLTASDGSDNDDTFEQCQQLYSEFVRQQQARPATSTSSCIHNVSNTNTVSSKLIFSAVFWGKFG